MAARAERSFAELLRRARREAGLTQEELAARAGVSTRAVSDLERSINRAPQLETLRLLADALELSADDRQLWSMARRRPSSRDDAANSQPSSAHLPTPLTSFVGRDREVAEIVALLRKPDTRIVTITGTGGVGKTRLAIAVGRAVEGPDGHFSDGVRFVNLAPLTHLDLVTRAIATALEIESSSRKPDLPALIAALRNARQLLVLDNVEHVVESAPQLAALLRACPGLTIMATSRVPLRVRGEREYKIRPFALPADIVAADLDRLRRFDAIDLFEQRARDIVADFRITADNGQAVAGICRRVDGLPLAIELVAARVRLLPPAALLARLERRLPLLTSAPHDAPARHQTLGDTIAWSYDLLEPAHQRLFRLLGVFQDGWTLDALEAVTGQSDAGSIVLDGLETLIAHSLVRMHEQTDGQPRYSMLETISEFAREKLEASDEALEARQRHAQHFRCIAREAEPHLTGAGQARWMTMLEQELANLRGALQWLHARGEQGDAGAVITAFQIADPIWWFWHVHGHMREARQLFETSMGLLREQQAAITALVGPAEWLRMHAKMLFYVSTLDTWQADHHDERAWQQMKQSLDIHRELDQRADIASTLMFLGYGSQRIGNFEEAEGYLKEGLAVSRELADDGVAALVLQGLGLIGLRRGDYERGSAWVTESLELFTCLGDERGIAASRATLGAILLRQHDVARANILLHESLTLRHRVGDKGGIAWCLEWMAEAALLGGVLPTRFLRAARLLGAATALRAAIDTPIDPVDMPDHARVVAAVQAQLTDPAFVAAWEAGRAMSLDDIVAYALANPLLSDR